MGIFLMPEVTKITIRENPTTTGGPVRPITDPKLVPWDQNFWVKIFLILTSDDVYLKVFLIY